MERGKMTSSGRGGKSKAPQHPQDIFALGSKSTVPVSRDPEKRNIHKPSTSGVERKREPAGFGSQPPNKRARIGSPAEAVVGTSLDVEPVDLVSNVLQALDTHNSDKLLGLLTGSIRLLKSQRSKPDPILCMGLLYLTKIRPNMFAHETVTNSLCTLLKREQGAAFKNKGNPLVFVLACNMLYAGHRDSNNWPDIFIKVYIEDALNERWWVECSWCKCLVENIVTAFGTKQPPSHLIPTDNTLGGTMSPSGSGSPLMGSTEEDVDNTDLEYSVFPRYSSSYEAVEGLVLEAIKDQIQRRSAAPDAIGKGFLKLLAATCGFPEIRMISASRLEAWLNSGKLWRVGQELLAYVCMNCDACGPTAARDHEVLAQLARMRLKTKPLQAAYQACLREMVSDSPALLRSVVTHTIYNELSNVRSPNNMSVLAALIQAQPQLVPAAMADTYLELVLRPEEYLRPLRALTREAVRLAREAGAAAAAALARALAAPPPHEAGADVRERAFLALADLLACCALLAAGAAAHARAPADARAALAALAALQAAALGWLLDTAVPCYRPARHDFLHALNKIMFVEPMETYTKVDNWPPESERALVYRMCCEAPLPQNNLLRILFLGLSKEIPISPAEVFELVEQVVRRACALPPDDAPLQVDKLEIADYIFQLCQFNPPDNITLPQGYTAPPLAITSLYWRGWVILTMLAAHNPLQFAERAAATYPTLRALIETCITNRPSLEWNTSSTAEAERIEAEKAAILQLESHLAAASNSKLPVTEHTSRLLSQLTTLEPLGPARKPPQAVIESLAALSQQLRLGKLLCRQPALLLSLVERHGTRRAMPWLHQLLRQDQLELSVLPVQCLCEFLSAGGGDGDKAGELCLHLRRTLHDTEDGARALLHYYLARLAHPHAHTRASAGRGLKLVLQTEDATDMDYNAVVNPEEWLGRLWELRHWAAVRTEAVARLRAACLVEFVPAHLAAYIHFLAKYVRDTPRRDHTDIVLDLSQVLMERTSVMAHVLGAGEPGREPAARHQRTLHALTHIFYLHLQKLFAEGPGAEPAAAWGCGERVSLLWPSGRRAVLHIIVAHAHLKLLCLGPSMYDSNQEMYTWLQQVWFGTDAPQAFLLDTEEEAVLLPDWLRLHLVRSARPCLLEAGLRALPAHKLALFIQTFGMPVQSMSALLKALDACPAGAVARLGVERGYMAQLLRVQRARGALGGAAFAAALRLQPPLYPPDDNLFAEQPLPEEAEDDWERGAEPRALQLELVPPVLSTAFGNQLVYLGDLDTALVDLLASITEEVNRLRLDPSALCPYINCVMSFLQLCAGTAGGALGLVRRPARAAAVLRALLPLNMQPLPEIASALLVQCKGLAGPVVAILQEISEKPIERTVVKRESDTPQIPPRASKEQLVALLESATPSTLESIGNKIIESQDTKLIVDVISHLLERNQDGYYESKIKYEGAVAPAHVFSARGRGCGLLLDWLSELQRETHPERQMALMFRSGGAMWRPLLVTLLAHRASWRTLHNCLSALLQPDGKWSPTAVLDFAETLIGSPRVWQGRDKATPKHAVLDDTLRLKYNQLDVLIRYVIREASEAERTGGAEGMRRRIESRLALVLRCCSGNAGLLAASLRAAQEQPMLLLLLYMKVPKIRQLLHECEERPPVQSPLQVSAEVRSAAAASTSATDKVSHSILTAIPHNQPHSKEHSQKVWRMEAGARAAWARVAGAGARALPLAGALLRGAGAGGKHHLYLLSAIEALPDRELFADGNRAELESIVECFLRQARQGGSRDTGLTHRVAALLRRHLAANPHHAQALLHKHHAAVQAIPALSALQTSDVSAPASAAPPPLALLALQRRNDTPENLHWVLQEVEAWGSRRGGGWGGAACAGALLRAVAPLAASPYAPLRNTALAMLAKLLPAVPDTKPGLQAILECLESNLPEVTQSVLDKLPELLAGMQEHAARLLTRVFELGVQSRYPVESCLAKCVVTINMMRGC